MKNETTLPDYHPPFTENKDLTTVKHMKTSKDYHKPPFVNNGVTT